MKIKAVIFGATGHIGQGVLIECLENPDVDTVLSIGRRASGKSHDKLTEILHNDFTNYESIAEQLRGYNACFFCLGVSSVGMSDEQYYLITHDFAVAAGKTLARLNPEMTFCFVSGSGSDDTLKSKLMWSRVKGKTENSLKALPFKAVYIFRPAFIKAVKGVKTPHTAYKLLGWLHPVINALFPKHVTTTEIVARAMIYAAQGKATMQTLESVDIKALGTVTQ